MTRFFISPGDPSGIGPEITLKALSKNKDIQNNFILAGDKTLYLDLIDRNNIELNLIDYYPRNGCLDYPNFFPVNCFCFASELPGSLIHS